MVKLWCIFWKGILTACSGFPEPSNGSPCMKWFRLCQRIAHLCTRGSQVTHYVQSKSRVVPHWNQEWPGVFCSAPQTAPEDWSGTLEMQEEVAVTSLRNPHWHLPPLKWFPKANEREETTFQLLYRASLLSLCLLCDHLTVPNTHQQLVFTLNQGTTENWSTGQLQPVHFPSFHHLSSNLEWYTLLSVLSIGQQAAAGDPGSVALPALSWCCCCCCFPKANPQVPCKTTTLCCVQWAHTWDTQQLLQAKAWAYLRNVSTLHRLWLQILADVAPRAEPPVSCLLVYLSDIVIWLGPHVAAGGTRHGKEKRTRK